ncbi:hypothetical protein D3C87_1558030 [compost metagenome]
MFVAFAGFVLVPVGAHQQYFFFGKIDRYDEVVEDFVPKNTMHRHAHVLGKPQEILFQDHDILVIGSEPAHRKLIVDRDMRRNGCPLARTSEVHLTGHTQLVGFEHVRIGDDDGANARVEDKTQRIIVVDLRVKQNKIGMQLERDACCFVIFI